MEAELSSEIAVRSSWSSTQVYMMAGVCLLLGVAIGAICSADRSRQ
jgi:hypothetical protein